MRRPTAQQRLGWTLGWRRKLGELFEVAKQSYCILSILSKMSVKLLDDLWVILKTVANYNLQGNVQKMEKSYLYLHVKLQLSNFY